MAKPKAAKSPMTLLLNSINQKTERVSDEDFNKIGGYVVTKLLSYRKELVLLCNELNKHPSVCKESAYDFYLGVVQKNRRFERKAVWDKNPDTKIIIEYFKCNESVAVEYLKLMTVENVDFIKSKLYKGGSA